MRALRGLLIWISILSMGCAGVAPTGGTPSSSEPSPMTRSVSPSPTALGEKGLEALTEAIQRGDWEKAQVAYEAAGGPPLPADLLNRAMAQGIYLALRAREAGKDPEADQHIRGALALVRQGCQCLDPQGGPIPQGFHDELYFYLVLADAKAIHWWERDEAVIQDPLWDEVVRRMAQRDQIALEDVRGIGIAECAMMGHPFLVVGFQIVDLLGTFRGTAPGLDRLQEGERNPRFFRDIACTDRRIEWINGPSAGGRGVALTAEWDGKGFRLVEVTRMDLAGETYQEVRRLIEAGELESAYDAYNRGFTNDIDVDPEIATLALRKGLEVARQRAAAGDVEGGLRALHNAFLLASFYYRLSGTFLPLDWEERPRTLNEWKQEIPDGDPLLYREALTEYAALMLMWREHRPDLVQLGLVEQILRGLIVLSPDYAPPYLYLGDALWEQGKHEEARRFYRQYRERAPDAPLPERVRERLP